jgi:hypothetical protein
MNEEFDEDARVPTSFPCVSRSRLPDVGDFGEDSCNLELVKCEAFVRLAALDPKQGTFRVRMKCIWAFRTHNSREDAELHLRGVPGIRMPGVLEVVEESRVWKDLTFSGSLQTTGNTVLWRGISLFTMDGFKAFEMSQFPFDRHILNLERLEFVWRPQKDDADYYKSMKLACLTVETSSMLPEWNVLDAYVRPLNAQVPDLSQGHAVAKLKSRCTWSHASKFTVQLRIERKARFYCWQVFLVTYLITMLTCTPLGMDPLEVGDRLAVFVGGMLTLVAFKYGVSDHLPSVPYQTFTDKFLLAQIMTIFFFGILTIVSYRIIVYFEDLHLVVDWFENIVGFLSFLGWTTALVMASVLKDSWRDTTDSWKSIAERDKESMDEWRQEEETRLSAGNAPESSLLSDSSTGVSAEEFRKLGLTQEQHERIMDWHMRGLLGPTAQDAGTPTGAAGRV